MNQPAGTLGALVALLLVTLAGCTPAGGATVAPSPAAAVRSMTVAPAEQRTVASTIDLEGDLVPVTTVAVTPKQTGRVESLPVDVGSEVNAGDVIAELDRDLLEAQAAQAAAAARSAEAQRDALIRTRSSNTARAITSDDIEAAEAATDQARAAAEAARVQLEQTSITAPITGTISQVNATVGQLVGPTAPIVGIVSADLEVKLTVDENRLSLIKAGQPVSFTVGAYPGESFGGRVTAVSPTIDRTSRTGEVTVSIDEGGPGDLVAGMFARVAITTAERPNVTVVPRAAVITRDQESFVYVVAAGVAQRRTVTIGRPTDNTDFVEIAEGVTPGEQVALTPSILTDGEQVTIFDG